MISSKCIIVIFIYLTVEVCRTATDNVVENRTVYILFLGSSGCGKSSTINFITKSQIAEVGGVDSVTQSIIEYEVTVEGGVPGKVVLIDTPGLGDTEGIDRDSIFLSSLTTFLKSHPNLSIRKPDIVLLCARFDDNRFYGSDSSFVKMLKYVKLVGSDILSEQLTTYGTSNSILLLTHYGGTDRVTQRNTNGLIEGFRNAISNFTSFPTNIKIVVGENEAVLHDYPQVGDSYKLLNGDLYPQNLVKALQEIKNGDVLAQILIKKAFEETSVVTFKREFKLLNLSTISTDFYLKLLALNLNVEETETSQNLANYYNTFKSSDSSLTSGSLIYLQKILNLNQVTKLNDFPIGDTDKASLLQKIKLDGSVLKLLQGTFGFEPALFPTKIETGMMKHSGKNQIFESVFKQNPIISNIGYLVSSFMSCQLVDHEAKLLPHHKWNLKNVDKSCFDVLFVLMKCQLIENPQHGDEFNVELTKIEGQPLDNSNTINRVVQLSRFFERFGDLVVTESSSGGKLQVCNTSFPTDWFNVSTSELLLRMRSVRMESLSIKPTGGNKFIALESQKFSYSATILDSWLESIKTRPSTIESTTKPIEFIVAKLRSHREFLTKTLQGKSLREFILKEHTLLSSRLQILKNSTETYLSTNKNSEVSIANFVKEQEECKKKLERCKVDAKTSETLNNNQLAKIKKIKSEIGGVKQNLATLENRRRELTTKTGACNIEADRYQILVNTCQSQKHITKSWFLNNVQLCYQWYPDGDGGQCGGGAPRHTCAKPHTRTAVYRDDTDRRGGGCQMQWGIISSVSSPPQWFSQVQLCYRWYADGDRGQCNNGDSGVVERCAALNQYTAYYRDDTDKRGGGCQMSWKLSVPTIAPEWMLKTSLCYWWWADGNGGQCGGGASNTLCARANSWTNYYRDDTDKRAGGCRMQWGLVPP